MKDWTAIRERYLRDGLSVRLGGLAANLRRIKSFSSHDTNGEVVERILDESKYFIEWTAAETGIDTAAKLVELQIQLACWQRQWAGIWTDRVQRDRVAEESNAWSKRILDLSGLLS